VYAKAIFCLFDKKRHFWAFSLTNISQNPGTTKNQFAGRHWFLGVLKDPNLGTFLAHFRRIFEYLSERLLAAFFKEAAALSFRIGSSLVIFGKKS